MIPVWVFYAAAGCVVLYSLSLTYWSYRVLVHEHPLDNPKDSSWFEWLVLTFALLGIEVPVVTFFVTTVFSFAAWLLHPYAGYGCAALAAIATGLYLYADHRDLEQSLPVRPQQRAPRE